MPMNENTIRQKQLITTIAVAAKFFKYMLFIKSAYSSTSNLYPTPHTVLTDHLSETPSSFSLRRLM